ncbi:MAG: cell division protein FtsW [Clostridia bacterium]|nr:cell division protein FtsW [Clostridia bacterium]
MNNNDKKRPPRAVRRPQNLNRGAAGYDSKRGANAPKNTRQGTSENASNRPRVTMGAGGRRLAVGRNSEKGRAVVPRRENRALAAVKREEEWQQEVERVRGGVDKLMLALVVLLVAFGALMVYSASYPSAMDEYGDSFYYLKKHLGFALAGGILMFVASMVPYTWYKKWGAIAAYLFALLLLIAVPFIGVTVKGAKRWINVAGINVQPSEIMKFAIVLILAWYIDKYREKMKERNGILGTYVRNTLLPLCFIGIAGGFVLLGKHLSGTFIVCAIGVAVMLVGGCHFIYTSVTALVAGLSAAVVYLMNNPYALKRITTFTSENANALAEDWQTTQGVLAIGSGGLFGVGFSESRQKFGYVSEAHNDFIYTIWCEELGFVGAVLLIGLFLLFIWRGYVIAMRAPDTFSMLTVFGITTQVALQAFLNMMVVCDIIPNTGISLPFFSYGGSSLLMLMLEMGIILSISKQYYRKKSI